jgi:phosphatidylserine/phosphatidylglycerophosphate/cardiolipin synthase-like enzyme
MSGNSVHFGGPDRPVGFLRTLLAQRVARVPAGGSIDWVTYYFRDRRLAAALVEARERGVDVRVTLDGHPRTPHANDAVIELLKAGLGSGLRVVRGRLDGTPLGKIARPRLHEKLYCFSHPTPVAFVGSFNPSSDSPEAEPAVVEIIGDHDRAHNALVELGDPDLVRGLTDHARSLHTAQHGCFDRFAASANRTLQYSGHSIYFWPRVRGHPIVKTLGDLERGSRFRIAASHISGSSSLRGLCAAAARDVKIEIVTESSHRRVPVEVEQRLIRAGISIRRLIDDVWVPMHNKFALVETPSLQATIFGSFNWSEPSYRFNREIGVATEDPLLFKAFADRWDQLAAEARHCG